MSIITKPGSIVKGVSATFTLDKSALAALSAVQNDPYFVDSSNWHRIHVVFKSNPGSQYEVVEFDATQSSPSGHFLISQKARDIFQVQYMEIFDFDGGVLKIPRSSLVTSEFDIDLT